MRNLCGFSAVVLGLLFFSGSALGQVAQTSGSASCLDGAMVANLFQVDDEVSAFGPKLEAPQLIALENGRKAVVFGVRNVPYNFEFQQWNIRYTVIWHDQCGRLLQQGSPLVDGFILHANEYRSVEVVSFHKSAVRASLRVYFE
jgi:hypothetical protein